MYYYLIIIVDQFIKLNSMSVVGLFEHNLSEAEYTEFLSFRNMIDLDLLQ